MNSTTSNVEPKQDTAPAKTVDAKTEEPATQQAPAAPAATLVVSDNEPTRALSAFSNETSFKTAQRMANALSASTLVPEAYRNNIPNVLIAMELANRIGASVFMVMQNLDIIHGRPGWRSQFLIATVNSSGRFSPLRFRWSGKRGSDDWGCQSYAIDKSTGEECIGATIDWRMVKAEGWSSKNGSKWNTMPEQMFMYRAAAFWTRVYAPELSLGMQTNDEVVDTSEVEWNAPAAETDKPRAAALADRIRARAGASEPVDVTPTKSDDDLGGRQ